MDYILLVNIVTDKNITFDDLIQKNSNIEGFFIYLCRKGYKELAEWLYNLSKTNDMKININGNNNEAFKCACKYGYKNIAVWLYDLSKNDNKIIINISENNDYIFCWSCVRGCKDIAEWLYGLSKTNDNTKININTRDEFAFRWTCSNGHIKTAQWLYDLSKTDGNKKININSRNDDAFKRSCKNKHKEIAEWLCTLDYHYKIKYDDDSIIPIIMNIKMILLDNDVELVKKIDKQSNDIKQSEDICMICLDNDAPYWIRLDCNHDICSNCFIVTDKCPLRCSEQININSVILFNNSSYKFEK